MSDSVIKEHPVTDMDKLILGFTKSKIAASITTYFYRGIIKSNDSYMFIYVHGNNLMHLVTYNKEIYNKAYFDAECVSTDVDIQLTYDIVNSMSDNITDFNLFFHDERFPNELTFDIIKNNLYMIDEDGYPESIDSYTRLACLGAFSDDVHSLCYKTNKAIKLQLEPMQAKLELLQQENSKIKEDFNLISDRLIFALDQIKILSE